MTNAPLSKDSLPLANLSWVGLTVDNNFIIDGLMQDGVFSWVYRGTNLHSSLTAVFKVSKPADLAFRDHDDLRRTRAFSFVAGEMKAVNPDTAALLCLQATKLGLIKDPCLVRLERLVLDAGLPYARLRWLEGKPLPEWCATIGGVPVLTILECASSLARLRLNPIFTWLGDLKAEHVFVTAGGITFLDPGYFGMLPCQEGMINCGVSTIINYPLMIPDDLLAFGFMLWDLTVGHPLGRISKRELEEVVGFESDINQRRLNLLNHLSKTTRPGHLVKGLSKPVENLLLDAVGLELDRSGRMQPKTSLSTFEDLILGLKKLNESGMKHLI